MNNSHSLNNLFIKGRRSSFVVEIPKKQTVSRQRSISELVSRVTKISLRPVQEKPQTYSACVDDYDLLRTIGSGATASVYSASYKPTGELIAIKTVNLDRSPDEETGLDALRKEIQIMTLSRHPHLLPVLQSFVHSSQLYIVTPLMSAGSCADLLLSNRCSGLKESIIACILKQVALGLDYLHSNELIHRDIKSANLLLDWDTGLVKLADFGVSNHMFNASDLPKKSESFLLPFRVPQPYQLKKARHSFVGTPCWMAPEILLGHDYDTKIDIWSLGITAIELAKGKPPFSQHDPLTVFTKIVHNPPPTLSWHTPGLQEFTTRCLEKDPKVRATISELLELSFLKRAPTPELMKRYLSQYHPLLNKRLQTKVHYRKQDSWPENQQEWNFDQPKLKLSTVDLDCKVNPDTDSPITPEDGVRSHFKKFAVL